MLLFWNIAASALLVQWTSGKIYELDCFGYRTAYCQENDEGNTRLSQNNFEYFLTHWLMERFAKNAFFGHFGGFEAGSRPN